MVETKLDKFINDLISILNYKRKKRQIKKKKRKKRIKRFKSKFDVMAEFKKRRENGLSNFSLELWSGKNKDTGLWKAAKEYGVKFDEKKKCRNGHDISNEDSIYKWKRKGYQYKRCKLCHRKNNRKKRS